jgi:hypothetical protein
VIPAANSLTGLVAVALLAYAVLGLVVPLVRSIARDLFPASRHYGGTEPVQIEVTTPTGKTITLPLRPDNEESIRDFLRKVDAATGG